MHFALLVEKSPSPPLYCTPTKQKGGEEKHRDVLRLELEEALITLLVFRKPDVPKVSTYFIVCKSKIPLFKCNAILDEFLHLQWKES